MARNLLTALLFAVVAGAALAQSKPLREDQITESAVAEALGVGADRASGVRTRGFRAAAPASGKREAPLLITFVSDSADLMPAAKRALDTVARVLRSDKLAQSSFRVEGHADPSGDDAHNQVLSQQRAESVVGYLVTEHGIDPARLQAVGKGSTELLNKTDKTAPENRRVTIVVR
jgi:outer membrane protein OmpA-like peptidoglycan-associated protein